MIRDASASDIPAMVGILEDVFARSDYSGKGEINVREAKRIFVNAVARHGKTHTNGCWLQVSESLGQVKGLILGVQCPIYHIGSKNYVTDLFWVALPDVDPKEPIQLLKNMVSWAKTCPDVIEVQCGATGILGDWRGSEVALKRVLKDQYGVMYRHCFNL